MHLDFESIKLDQDSLSFCMFTNPFTLWKVRLRAEAAETMMQPEKLATTLRGKPLMNVHAFLFNVHLEN